jgi:hypothetical protein
MGWGDPASWSTTTSELQYALPVYYRKKILELINTPSGLWDKLDIEAFPQRSGTTATFSKYGKMDYTASVTLTQGANPDPTDLVTGNVTAAIVEKGGVVAIPDLARLSIVDGTKKVSEVVAAWAKEAMEYYVATTLTPYLKQVRDDADATYQKNSASTSAGAAGGTTIVDTALTEADDFWNGALVTITDPKVGIYGESQYVTDFVAATDTLTVDAFSQQVASGVSYHICIPTALAAGDEMSLAGIRKCQKELRAGGGYGPRFELAGGGYNMILDTDQEDSIGNDSNFTNLYIYKEKETGIRTWPESGRIAMCRPEVTGIPYRTAVTGAGTYSATGVIRVAAIFGKQAMKKMPLGINDIDIIAKGESSGGVANPLNRYSTAGWKARIAAAKMDMNVGVGYHTYEA